VPVLYICVLDPPPFLSYYSEYFTYGKEKRRILLVFTVNSTIAEIMKKPNVKPLIDKHFGRTVDGAQLQMVSAMTLQQVANFLGWSKEKVEAIIKDLNA
jgi:hypothetical protein